MGAPFRRVRDAIGSRSEALLSRNPVREIRSPGSAGGGRAECWFRLMLRPVPIPNVLLGRGEERRVFCLADAPLSAKRRADLCVADPSVA